jgi:hypothetical protein
MNSTGKAAIVEHHRSAQWSEREYVNLYNLVQQHQGLIRQEMVEQFNPDEPMFYDYCRMLTVNIHMQAARLSEFGYLPSTLRAM